MFTLSIPTLEWDPMGSLSPVAALFRLTVDRMRRRGAGRADRTERKMGGNTRRGRVVSPSFPSPRLTPCDVGQAARIP